MAKAKGRISNVVKERFWSRVVKTRGCWHWQGSGSFRVSNTSKVTPKRVAYILTTGSIPAGTPLLATCGNSNCVNPAHQEPKTKRSRARRCAQCGEAVKKHFSQISRSESGRVFCNRSCSTSYNNKGKRRFFGSKDWGEISSRSSVKGKWVREGLPLTCVKCGFDGHKKKWCIEIDHIQPIHLGGKTSLDNLQPLCLNCHMDKTVMEHTARATGA